MNPTTPPPLGGNIRKYRLDGGLTLEVLADRSGVSKAMLSQIESGKVNPTVATVWKISQGLNIEINLLLEGSEGPVRKFHLARKDNHTVLDTDEEGLHIHVLTPVELVEDLEMYLLTFSPGGALRSEPHFPHTEEFITVLSGSVQVQAGDKDALLCEGDFIRYQCDVPHSIENTGETVARVHMVVRFQRRLFT